MNLHLINGQYNAKDALHIISEMIQIKIKFQEGKITAHSSEEDIKMRELRIRQLQNELGAAREFIASQKGNVTINSIIELKH